MVLYRKGALNVARQCLRALTTTPVGTGVAPVGAGTAMASPFEKLRGSGAAAGWGTTWLRSFAAATPSTPKRAEAAMEETYGSDHLGKAAASIAPTGKITQVRFGARLRA